MNELDIFLRILKKEGYPNNNFQALADVVGYDTENFLPDLKKKLGQKGVNYFCAKTIDKLQGKNGTKINLWSYGEYVVFKLRDVYYDEDEMELDVIVTLDILDSRISVFEDGVEALKPYDEIYQNADMGEMGDVSDLYDSILTEISDYVNERCGFGIGEI